MALHFPAPLDPAVKQFISATTPFWQPQNPKTDSEKFICLLHCKSNHDVQENARSLLANLAQFPENKDVISDLKLFPDLIPVVKNANPQLQTVALMAVANLMADNQKNQTEALEAGLLEDLPTNLKSLSDQARDQVLRIVMHLSRTNSLNAKLMAKKDLLKGIAESIPASASKTTSQSIEYALYALTSLGAEPKNATGILEAGFAKVLSDYITSPVATYREYALFTVQLLTGHSLEWRKILSTGGTHSVPAGGCIGLLIPQLSSKSPAIVRRALVILKNFLLDYSPRDGLAHANGAASSKLFIAYQDQLLPLIFDCTGSADKAIVKSAYILLSEISQIEQIHPTFAKQGGASHILKLITATTDPELVIAGSALLSFLLEVSDDILQRFLDDQGIASLLSNLPQVNPAVRAQYLGMIANVALCSDQVRDEFFRDPSKLQSVVEQLSSDDEKETQKQTLRVLVNLALAQQHVPLLVRNTDLLKRISGLLSAHGSVHPGVIQLLVNLTAHEEIQQPLIQAVPGGPGWFSGLLGVPDEGLVLCALKILTNLSTTGRNRKWIHESPGCMDRIRSFSSRPSSDDLRIQSEAALANLSFPYEAHYDDESVEQAKALPEIVDLDEEDEQFGEDEDESSLSPQLSKQQQEEAEQNAKKLELMRLEMEQAELEQKRIQKQKDDLARQMEEQLRQEQEKQKQLELEALEQIRKEEEELLRAFQLKQAKELEELQKQQREQEKISDEPPHSPSKDRLKEHPSAESSKLIKDLEDQIAALQKEETDQNAEVEAKLAENKQAQEALRLKLDKASKKVRSLQHSLGRREKKLSKSTILTGRTERKLSVSMETIPPNLESKPKELLELESEHAQAKQLSETYSQKIQNTQRRCDRQQKKLTRYDTKAKNLEQQQESLLQQASLETSTRNEKLAQLREKLKEALARGGGSSESGRSDLQSGFSNQVRENQLQELQKQRQDREVARKDLEAALLREQEEIQREIQRRKDEQERIAKERAEKQRLESQRKKEEAEKQLLAEQERIRQQQERVRQETEQLEREKQLLIEKQKQQEKQVEPSPRPAPSEDQARLNKMIVRRTNIAREILDTEKSYVNSLKTLVWKFVKPLQEHARAEKMPHLASLDEIRSLFSNVEIILNFNKILLESIEQRLRNWSNEQCLGDIFVKMTDFLRCYVEYVNNFELAINLLTKLKKENQALQKFISKAESLRVCNGLTLESFMIMPVQRIPRYVMLLSDLVSNTVADHVDSENLKKALEKMKDTGDFVNESKRNSESLAKFQSVFSSLTGKVPSDLVQPHRKLVRDSVAKWVRNFSVHLFLLTDLLLVTKPKGSSNDVRYVLSLVDISIAKVDKTPNSIKITSIAKKGKKADFVFSFSTEKERNGWYDEISSRHSQEVDKGFSFQKGKSTLG